ncbi:MAG TPA: hypothetical protein VIX18_06445 [Nitrospirota bacterium]
MAWRKRRESRLLFLLSALVLGMTGMTTPAMAVAESTAEPSFLYKLSDYNGIMASSGVRMFSDAVNEELFVLDGGTIRIFNQAGMEVYRINDDGSLGSLTDSVVTKEGDIIALSFDQRGYFLIKCNYRGELTTRMELQNVPGAIQAGGFRPTFLAYREGHLYLVDSAMMVIVTDEQGRFEQSIDLFDAAGLPEKKRGNVDMMGFSIDREGSMFFTVPAEFCAFKRSPDGSLASFCQRGSGPGKFNIAAGIVSDDSGYIYVSDKLKSAVLIFDKEFKFVNQMGYRGAGPYGLIVPMEMAVLGNKLYVSQGAGQGVSVFSITH